MKLINGDCLVEMRHMVKDAVDHVLTSPPYGRKRNDKYDFFDDRIEDYGSWLIEVVKECLRVARGYVFFNIQATYYNRSHVYKLIGHFSEKIVDIIIWEKSNPMPASGFSITNAVEYVIVMGDESLKSNRTYTKNHITTPVNSKMTKLHRAVMPIEVANWVVSSFTKEGEVVLDPFMGIGTTGKSCLSHKREFIGIEISEIYFNESLENLSNINQCAMNL